MARTLRRWAIAVAAPLLAAPVPAAGSLAAVLLAAVLRTPVLLATVLRTAVLLAAVLLAAVLPAAVLRAAVLLAAVFLAALSLTLSGCSIISPLAGYCVPRVHIEPATVHPGDTITVTSSDTCGATEPGGGWIVVAGHVGDGGMGPVQVRTSDPFDGSFHVELALPEDFPTGDAYAGISNWDFSPCADNASCAAPMGNFIVEK